MVCLWFEFLGDPLFLYLKVETDFIPDPYRSIHEIPPLDLSSVLFLLLNEVPSINLLLILFLAR
jgi:hypothetical protein